MLPCCDKPSQRCVGPAGFVPFVDPGDFGVVPLTEYQCFTPQQYLDRARRLFQPVWESPVTEVEVREG
jgi:hypothetical protein